MCLNEHSEIIEIDVCNLRKGYYLVKIEEIGSGYFMYKKLIIE
jgi:hypothetical protein